QLERRTYDYTRSGNPTRDLLGAALADLEGGAAAVVTASGMAALALFAQLLGRDDVLVVPREVYGGSHRLFHGLAARKAFEVVSVDYRDEAELDAVAARGPTWFWVETPSNPLLRLTDIAAVVVKARSVGARVAVDNTFASPLLQQPLALGCDLVVHSTTKYLNGHSDVVGGAVIAREAALHDEVAWWANCLGVTGAPFDAFLTLRGLRTLALRLRAHEENAACIAERLEALRAQDGSAVADVHWPGLTRHADHALARRQQRGFGGMLSFELAEVRGVSDIEVVRAFTRGLTSISVAESLGGVESLIAHPATMTHKAMAAEARASAGIGDRLLRLSVGIEDVEDLWAELEAGIARVSRLVLAPAAS
ncbi:MAG TPA: PLP-dependent transferase, partial [Planctomycetota bacterium]|nr:PLP-dependent transferase [Planctomycetota bacterium]